MTLVLPLVWLQCGGILQSAATALCPHTAHGRSRAEAGWSHPWIKLQTQIPSQWFGSKAPWACVTVLIRARHCYKELSSWSWSLLLLKDIVTLKTGLFHLKMKHGHMVYEERTQGIKRAKASKEEKDEKKYRKKMRGRRTETDSQIPVRCYFLSSVTCHFPKPVCSQNHCIILQ